jgi:hypothetical protein
MCALARLDVMKERTLATKAACVAGSDGMAKAMPLQSFLKNSLSPLPSKWAANGPNELVSGFPRNNLCSTTNN